ncbi:cation transporter [Flavobacterium sp. SE-s28]|uniref:Cation transporter n=1 Tax=Flavobacterium silvaticum TaxID=1852020 RepID=A0A972FLS3_9FLAO|nr:cation transporter [Flavobacterium silvaticum]
MGHGHDHSHGELHGKNLLISILLNVAITASQVIGGILSGSLALLSDALHNFSDVLSLVFSFIAHRLSHRKATHKETFGYKRAEILAAFVNAATLVIVALILIYEAVERFFSPQHIESNLVIWLSVLGIVANGFSVFLLKADADRNLNMKSAYLHLLTDTMASVAVLIGGLLMKFFNWYWVDSVLTLAIAVYLIVVGYGLLKDSTRILMLFTPTHLSIEEIASEVHKIRNIGKLYHMHLWHLNDEELHLEAHLACPENLTISEFNQQAETIEKLLKEKFGINHCTIQPDFNKQCSKEFIVQE